LIPFDRNLIFFVIFEAKFASHLWWAI